MADSLDQTDSDILKYRHYRSVGFELNSKIFRTAVDKQILTRAAKSLNIKSEKALRLEDEGNLAVLYDLSFYEVPKLGKSIVEHFYEANRDLNETENKLISAMIKTTAGLFRIEKVMPENDQIELQEITETKRNFILTDSGMSNSTLPGMILFLRPLEIENIVMTSGVTFVFPQEMEDELVRKWKTLKPKDRFPGFFRLNRIKGIPMMYQ